MKERAITFIRLLAIAAREGRKTQTRRVVRIPPVLRNGSLHGNDYLEFLRHCPYGQPGDRLWVREPYYQFGHWEPIIGKLTKGGKQKWGFVPDSTEIRFEAPETFRLGRHHRDPGTPAWHKRLARFMPRSASRTLLEIVSIRVERLRDISEKDSSAEGADANRINPDWTPEEIELLDLPSADPATPYKNGFALLWRGINGFDSWASNPWVWVIEFKRVTE